MPCNWKFAAENFGGDGYHFPITHISALKLGRRAQELIGNQAAEMRNPGKSFNVSLPNGHSVMTQYHESRPPSDGPGQMFVEYADQIFPEIEERLGPARARTAGGVGNIFPNLSFLRGGSGTETLRVWHPRGPDKIEIWSWCLVDKAAPTMIKEAKRQFCLQSFSPSGMFEQDDAENWVAATDAAKGTIARRLVYNYQMRLGRTEFSEDHPGDLGPSPNEHNQRGFYGHWLELMTRE